MRSLFLPPPPSLKISQTGCALVVWKLPSPDLFANIRPDPVQLKDRFLSAHVTLPWSDMPFVTRDIICLSPFSFGWGWRLMSAFQEIIYKLNWAKSCNCSKTRWRWCSLVCGSVWIWSPRKQDWWFSLSYSYLYDYKSYNWTLLPTEKLWGFVRGWQNPANEDCWA